jgi:LysR family glycine cleavage system transcriptional activator
MLDLESLRCFLAASEHLNFRAAARAVHLSPAAFGARIRRLEEDVGAPLFARTTREVKLTASGDRLVSHARHCLAEIERCASVVSSSEPQPYTLTLGTRYELGMSWLVPALDVLAKAHPERAIHLHFGDSHDLLPRVQRGALDAMVTSVRLGQTQWDSARLHEEHYVFVGTPKVLDRRPVRGFADVQAHRLIDAHADLPLFSYLRDARPSRELWRFESIEYMGTIAAVRARVLSHAGLAVLPVYFVRADLARGRLRRILPNTRLPSDWFRLVWRAAHPRHHALRQVADELVALPLR